MVIHENDAGEKFIIICQGKIGITKEFDDKDEFLLSILSDGDFFGEMALLDEGPRSATAKALDTTTVIEISRSDFETLLYRAPGLAYRIMKELSLRLRETDALLISYLQQKHRQLSEAYIDTLLTIVKAIEARDPYAAGHTERVMMISKAIGQEMGLTSDELFGLEIGALLHDVGKISISETILLKPGPLDDKEYAEIKKHPEKGKELIEGVSFHKDVIPHVLYHHERLDGSGYPEKLKGSDIPLVGRILAVADVFDAMVSDRPYRKRFSYAKALEELESASGKLFDQEIVDSFARLCKANKISRLLRKPQKNPPS